MAPLPRPRLAITRCPHPQPLERRSHSRRRRKSRRNSRCFAASQPARAFHLVTSWRTLFLSRASLKAVRHLPGAARRRGSTYLGNNVRWSIVDYPSECLAAYSQRIVVHAGNVVRKGNVTFWRRWERLLIISPSAQVASQ